MYIIYKVTNLINQKIYIGKTNDLERRKKEHEQKNNNSLIDRAIKRYGKENFNWEVIELVEKEKSNDREKYWIKYYNSYFRSKNSNGYNMTKGGDGGSCWNIQKVHIYDLKGNYIRTFESMNELRKQLNTNTSFKNYRKFLGKYIMVKFKSNEIPEKIELKKNKSRAIPILQLDENKKVIKRYNSIVETKKYGFNRTGIIGCLKGTYKKSGNYFWCYEKDYQNYKIPKENKEIQSYKNDKILQFSTDGILLNYYFNCSEASRKNNIKSNKVIHKALNSKSHFSNGFLWYKESDLNNMLIPR